MMISVLCSSIKHPIYSKLSKWVEKLSISHNIELIHSKDELSGGDILFLISCNEIISKEIRDKYTHSLVLHASDLPNGKGWSPHIWQILEGKDEICVSLIEAEDNVDSGAIWKQETVIIAKHELYDEINEKIFNAEFLLMDYALENHKSIHPIQQEKTKGSFYRKRTPEDSKVDPDKSIIEQFNLMRVSDPDRYPAYFELNSCKYEIHIKKV